MKRILGIWDLTRSGGMLGTLLLLLEELQIQRQIHDVDGIDIIAAGENADQIIRGIPLEPIGLIDRVCWNNIKDVTPLIAVLRSMSCVNTLYKCSRSNYYQDLLAEIGSSSILWPSLDALKNETHNYDSTLIIQEHFNNNGSIPHISVNDDLLKWAKNYLHKKCEGKLSVAVHLKNNINKTGQSIADMDAWKTFFLNCQTKERAHFVLIGDDPISEQVRKMPNITIAQEDGFTLDHHLALIQAADLFIGMMSGPACMAILGTQPYLIFKNPDHHATEMIAELGDRDHYSFAKPYQRVLRAWDTPDTLINSFDNMIAEIEA
jgi:hypothetical protein